MTRAIARLLRNLILIPLTALVVFELAALLPPRVDKDDKVEIVLHDAETSPLPRALAFLEPWRKLHRGDRIGSVNRYRSEDILRALRGSLRVGAIALGMAILGGILYALIRGGTRSPVVREGMAALPVLAYGTPTFVIALVVAMQLGIPMGPREYAAYEPIMAAVIAIGPALFFGTILDGALAEEAGRPYVDTAVAKGRSRTGALFRHALPNALPALLDALPPVATALLTGSFIAEKLFNVKYFGLIYVDAALHVDVEVVVVATTLFASVLLLVGAIADVLRAAIDPRVRTEEG